MQWLDTITDVRDEEFSYSRDQKRTEKEVCLVEEKWKKTEFTSLVGFCGIGNCSPINLASYIRVPRITLLSNLSKIEEIAWLMIPANFTVFTNLRGLNSMKENGLFTTSVAGNRGFCVPVASKFETIPVSISSFMMPPWKNDNDDGLSERRCAAK